MTHANRFAPWLLATAALAAVLVAVGAPLSSLLPFAVVLACPAMMLVMMRGMGGTRGESEDHSGHGCDHDSNRRAGPPSRTPQ